MLNQKATLDSTVQRQQNNQYTVLQQQKLVKLSPIQNEISLQIFNSILPSNCLLRNTNVTRFVIGESSIPSSTLHVNKGKKQRCSKQLSEWDRWTPLILLQKVANVFKNKTKQTRKINSLHQIVSYKILGNAPIYF